MVLKPERTPTRNPSRKSPIYRFVTSERGISLGAVLLIFTLVMVGIAGRVGSIRGSNS